MANSISRRRQRICVLKVFNRRLGAQRRQSYEWTRIEQFGQIKDKVVETPWTYSAALSENEIHPQPTRVSSPPAPSSRVREAAPEPASAATAAQPPAAAVATPSHHAGTYLVYCVSLTGPDVYVSDKFELPPFQQSATGTIQIAFHQFLHEKYSLPIDYQSAPISCGLDMGEGGRGHSLTSVEANIEAIAKEGKKIVKTGWKYVGTLPPPDVPGAH